MPCAPCVVLCALLAAVAGCRRTFGEPATEPIDPGVEPVQEALGSDRPVPAVPGADKDLLVVARARYRIAARVLSRERYYLGWQADVSPLDLALGWRGMSNPEVDEWIDWQQRHRWYFWQWREGSPYQNAQIRVQSANVHIVPATANLRRALLGEVDVGDVVQLSGYLIDIIGPDNQRWPSSLSRKDTGNGSCELMNVDSLTVDGRTYH